MKVLAVPIDSPGTIAYYVVMRTGSRDEVEAGHSGFAHFFEHMMFRGTEKYSKDAYNDVLKRLGADSNAFTADDETVFHMIAPASQLPLIMDIESDRFKNLKYDQDAFRTEALAVFGEYNKSVSNPIQPMFEKLRDLAFEKHTYKHTTIGFVADIKAMPGYYDYSLQFFNRFYRPENATLLVVGDVKPEEAFALAKQYFGDWKKGYKPANIPAEPPQTAKKTAAIDWPNPTHPLLLMGYHIPADFATSVDSAALDLVGELLFSESAPLYQDLVVKNQWVDFVQGGTSGSRDPGLFTVLARVKSDDLVPKVQETIGRYIHDLQTKPVDAKQLDRIKSHQRYAFELGLDTPGNVAAQAAQAIAVYGDIDALNQRFATYQKVTPADIQRVARKFFQPQNETVVTLSHKAARPPPRARREVRTMTDLHCKRTALLSRRRPRLVGAAGRRPAEDRRQPHRGGRAPQRRLAAGGDPPAVRRRLDPRSRRQGGPGHADRADDRPGGHAEALLHRSGRGPLPDGRVDRRQHRPRGDRHRRHRPPRHAGRLHGAPRGGDAQARLLAGGLPAQQGSAHRRAHQLAAQQRRIARPRAAPAADLQGPPLRPFAPRHRGGAQAHHARRREAVLPRPLHAGEPDARRRRRLPGRLRRPADPRSRGAPRRQEGAARRCRRRPRSRGTTSPWSTSRPARSASTSAIRCRSPAPTPTTTR